MPNIILSPFLIGFILTVFFTPVALIFAKRYGFIDDPKTHKHPAILHKKPIPRAGGLAIFAALFVGSLILFNPIPSILVIILFSGFTVVFVGILDDKYDLSPYLRFLFNIISASIVVFSGVTLPFITNPLLGGILEFKSIQIPFITNLPIAIPQILAIIWIVWVMNMLNWSKGVDGQMPGIAAISAGVIGIASLRFLNLDETNILVSSLSFLVAGSSFGFLFYNFYPAKIFPGYSATILGFMLGILSIMSSVKLATAILVMGVPMADAVFTIIRRIISKRSPFLHDKGHLHHLLLDLGLSQRAIAFLYWFVTLMLGVIALNMSSKGKLFAIIVLAILVVGIIISLRLLVKKDFHDD